MDGFNGESETGDWGIAKSTMTEASERRHAEDTAEDTAEDAADGNAMLPSALPHQALSLTMQHSRSHSHQVITPHDDLQEAPPWRGTRTRGLIGVGPLPHR